MLLIAPADPRHIIKTMARAWRYNHKFLNVKNIHSINISRYYTLQEFLLIH